ncbi:isocitrate/isopropylmalate family dehydrogenase [Candidatus Protofrankia californiensis]|uniref:isocitrate/isopropylmalate family dehydrogenase n=1 Tax=Candidatus Protofrankia californiensis TaxID=1839754 RepID=UPI00104162D8|nr:isocitrate/isopropylmalate family dehydrogenase [Candidatus Protofrankia californiensis]
MPTHRVTLIPGDGTGPELTGATRRVLAAAVATVGSSFGRDVPEAGVDIMETADLAVAPGANIGTEAAVFAVAHGSAPKYKSQRKVNPAAMILSGKLMPEHRGKLTAAVNLENAVAAVIEEARSVTCDSKPTRTEPTAVGTVEYADAIIEKLRG